MSDIRSDMEQGAQEHRGAPEERDGEDKPGMNATAEAIQVLVLSPDETPRLQTIENRPDVLQALVGGHITTFPTSIEGTVVVVNAEGALSTPPPDCALGATGTSISEAFVVAGDAGDGVSLQSISPLQLEQALERFAPTLTFAQFEQIMRSHPLGPDWIANWEPPEM